jgi:hypothetical protein
MFYRLFDLDSVGMPGSLRRSAISGRQFQRDQVDTKSSRNVEIGAKCNHSPGTSGK